METLSKGFKKVEYYCDLIASLKTRPILTPRARHDNIDSLIIFRKTQNRKKLQFKFIINLIY